MRTLPIAVCLLVGTVVPLRSWQESLPKAPTDVKPGSITYDDIAYPVSGAVPPVHNLRPGRAHGLHGRASGRPANGRTVVLFHGMNFGGFYFGGPIEALRKEGFRVIVPDQIGFGRSSKPIIPYNFHDMALNSRKLLQSLGIATRRDRGPLDGRHAGGALRGIVSGHDRARRHYDPIGLTDVRFERPWRTADDAYKATWARRTINAGRVLREHPALFSRAGRMEARV